MASVWIQMFHHKWITYSLDIRTQFHLAQNLKVSTTQSFEKGVCPKLSQMPPHIQAGLNNAVWMNTW